MFSTVSASLVVEEYELIMYSNLSLKCLRLSSSGGGQLPGGSIGTGSILSGPLFLKAYLHSASTHFESLAYFDQQRNSTSLLSISRH